MSLRYEKILEIALLGVFFCFAISLFNLAGYIFIAMVVAMLLLHGKKMYITSTDMLLFLFSTLYFFFHCLHFEVEINTFVWYFIGPWGAYFLGRMYMLRSKNNHAFVILLIVLAFGMFLHGLLNVLAYTQSEYYVLYTYYRQSVDFWRNELVNVKSTEMLLTFATGVGIGVLFTTYKVKYKIMMAVVLFFSILSAAFLANRGLFLMGAIIFAWRLFFWFRDKDVSANKKGIAIAAGLSVLTVGLILVVLNVGGLRDMILDLKIMQRFTSEDELTRFDVWEVFFKDFKFLWNPFGGKYITETTEWGYLHNTWLDCYNVVGIVPFTLLIILTVRFVFLFIRFGRVAKARNKTNEYVIFQCVILASVLNMMIEPVIEGNPYFFLTTLIFLGAMDGYTKILSETSIENRLS